MRRRVNRMGARQRKAVMAKLSHKKLRGHTLVINVAKKQSGSTNAKYDHMHKALKPGMRKTAWKTKYFENRENRSDKHPSKYKTTI
jgi:hypothetical protein